MTPKSPIALGQISRGVGRSPTRDNKRGREKRPRRSGKIVLYRQQVEMILVQAMGWEHEDALQFWQYARWETSHPGCLEEALRAETERLLAELKTNGAP